MGRGTIHSFDMEGYGGGRWYDSHGVRVCKGGSTTGFHGLIILVCDSVD